MLTAQQIAEFHRDGFLIIRGVFKGRELAELRKASDAVVAEGVAGKGKDHSYWDMADGSKVYYRSERMWTRGEIYKAATVNPALLEAIGQCYGHPFFPFNDSFVCKVPRGNVPIPWHQDPPYGGPKGHAESCPIPNFDTDIYLDDSTIKNGCVWGIPGRHLVGHVEIERYSQSELFEKLGTVPMEMTPGDVLFHSISGPHGSIGNVTDTIRRIFYVHYIPQEAFDIDYGYQAWAKTKNPSMPENVTNIESMLVARKKMGFDSIESSHVKWSKKGFEVEGVPTTPPYYWKTLAGKIPAEVKGKMKRLEAVETGVGAGA